MFDQANALTLNQINIALQNLIAYFLNVKLHQYKLFVAIFNLTQLMKKI
jgi:hypothetical protein